MNLKSPIPRISPLNPNRCQPCRSYKHQSFSSVNNPDIYYDHETSTFKSWEEVDSASYVNADASAIERESKDRVSAVNFIEEDIQQSAEGTAMPSEEASRWFPRYTCKDVASPLDRPEVTHKPTAWQMSWMARQRPIDLDRRIELTLQHDGSSGGSDNSPVENKPKTTLTPELLADR